MALTIIKRPEACKLSAESLTATVGNSGGLALFNFPAHALSTGDIIYIYSDVDGYNGFKYVNTVTINSFFISDNEDSEYVMFHRATDVKYYTCVLNHMWQSVHMPIVYKVKTDLFPDNQVNATRIVSSYQDDNGYVRLNLSGALASDMVVATPAINLAEGLNKPDTGLDWTLGSSPSVTTNTTQLSDYWYVPFDFIVGNSYTFTLNITRSVPSNQNVIFRVYDNAFISEEAVAGNTINSLVLTFVATSNSRYLAVRSAATVSGSSTITITSITGTTTTPGFNRYDTIKINGAGDLTGVYNILTRHTSSSITIDLNYSDDYNFDPPGDGTMGSVVLNKNNYHVKVRVYGGLNNNHALTLYKPYELLGTINIVPDSENLVMFSINEIIKSQIITRNNLLGNTLPNNLDFWTQFYISIAESYDQSNGEEVTTYVTSYSSDAVNAGYAVNSVLPFKNRNINFMSDYIYASGYPAKWLTNFQYPIQVIGYFFDLSIIINEFEEPETFISVPACGLGQDVASGNSWFEVGTPCYQTAQVTSALALTKGLTTFFPLPITNFTAVVRGVRAERFNGAPTHGSITISLLSLTNVVISSATYPINGTPTDYEISYNGVTLINSIKLVYTNSLSGSQNSRVYISGDLDVYQDSSTGSDYTLKHEYMIGASISFTVTEDLDVVGVGVHRFEPSPDLVDRSIYDKVRYTVLLNDIPYSETIQVSLIQVCEDSTNIPISNDNIRLLEDGDYRLLE